MRKRLLVVVVVAMVAGGTWLASRLIQAQGSAGQQATASGQFPAYQPPRMADGKPNFNGIWQSVNTGNWDLEAHSAAAGLHPELLGAWGAQPGGQSIVEGGVIPYRPEALARRMANFEKRASPSVPGDGVEPPLGDPELKCWMPGVPRSMYMPYPLQIVQTPDSVLITHEFNGSTRIVRMNSPGETPVDNTFFMGWSRGRWDGETLVVEVTDFNDQTWFDRAGNFHSEALHVVERYTPIDPYHLMYEATIEDPKVFTRPWTLKMPLYRHVDKGAQIREYKCVEFVEELMYGHLGVVDPATGQVNK